jgi:purine catabolism regulator
VAVIYPANAPLWERILTSFVVSDSLTIGESTETGLTDIGRAYREAEQALGIGIRSHQQHIRFSEIGASAMLELLATPQATAFAESLLRPLVDHDANGRGDLVTSLGAWLEHNGQWDAAAAELGVHRHTLRNRIHRVSELLGRDLDVAAVRVELWTAVRLLS